MMGGPMTLTAEAEVTKRAIENFMMMDCRRD